jgi:hypothetical protein
LRSQIFQKIEQQLLVNLKIMYLQHNLLHFEFSGPRGPSLQLSNGNDRSFQTPKMFRKNFATFGQLRSLSTTENVFVKILFFNRCFDRQAASSGRANSSAAACSSTQRGLQRLASFGRIAIVFMSPF